MVCGQYGHKCRPYFGNITLSELMFCLGKGDFKKSYFKGIFHKNRYFEKVTFVFLQKTSSGSQNYDFVLIYLLKYNL